MKIQTVSSRKKAYAKINLTLNVVGKRADGYHDLESIMQTVSLCDDVEVEAIFHWDAEQPCVTVELEVAADDTQPSDQRLPEQMILEIPLDNKNTAYKAGLLFLEQVMPIERPCGVHLRIRITKRIPVAAGLAGGSADAAAVLLALTDIFSKLYKNEENSDNDNETEIGPICAERVKLPTWNQLLVLAKRIGADVPFCMTGGTVYVQGIGELLNRLPELSQEIWIVLVNPMVPVSTSWVFQNYRDEKTDKEKEMQFVSTNNVVKSIGDWYNYHNAETHSVFFRKICDNLFNDLETVTIKGFPSINDIKNGLMQNGALRSLMSGSGPTVFGLFDSKMAALQAKKWANRLGFWTELCRPVPTATQG